MFWQLSLMKLQAVLWAGAVSGQSPRLGDGLLSCLLQEIASLPPSKSILSRKPVCSEVCSVLSAN